MKQASFYKNDDEKAVAAIAGDIYHKEVGCRENAQSDGDFEFMYGKDDKLTLQMIYDIAFNEVMRKHENGYYQFWNGSRASVEDKHLHFIGADRVREIIKHHVDWLWMKDPDWKFPNGLAETIAKQTH